MGRNLWLTCFSESLHTTHTGCLSSKQKSLSFSLWRLQTSSDPEAPSSVNDSHTFFNTRLQGGLSFEDLLLQIGQSWVFLVSQNFWRHFLQTLWLHDRITGALNISLHTGQERSSTDTVFTKDISSFQIQWSWPVFHFLFFCFINNH